MILEARGIAVTFQRSAGAFRRPLAVRAVDGIDLVLDRDRTLALVGESGCGKSTAARALLAVHRLARGAISYEPPHGEARLDVGGMTARDLRAYRHDVRMVFQDPFASLNPRFEIRDAVAEPLRLLRGRSEREIAREVGRLLDDVGLASEHARRYPHELSGGQRQRVAIARALAPEPRIVLLDEAVSALDVSVRAGVLNLLARLQRERNLGYLFVSHDLSVVRHVADDIAVMYLGRIVEHGPRSEVLDAPQHPYTRALVDAVPSAHPSARRARRHRLEGDPPDAAHPPTGCAFHPRCSIAIDRCRSQIPLLRPIGDRLVACHLASSAPALVPDRTAGIHPAPETPRPSRRPATRRL